MHWTNGLIRIRRGICKTKLSILYPKQTWRCVHIVTPQKEYSAAPETHCNSPLFHPSPLSVNLAFWFFQPQLWFHYLPPCAFLPSAKVLSCFTMIRSSFRGNSGPTLSHALIQIVYFFGGLCLSTYAACYFPNGSDRNAEYGSEVYQPCNRSAEHSMCCRAKDHTCRSDGLCFDSWSRLVWRESCTDATWNSSACVKLCTSGTGIPH